MAVSETFKKLYTGLFISALIFFIITVLRPISVSDTSFSKYIATAYSRDQQLEKISTREVVIFFWTKFFGRRPPLPDPDAPCIKGCHFFHQERAVYSISDAVIFHSGSLPNNVSDIPPTRDIRQVWVFMELESPVRFRRNDLRGGTFDNFFNWTMTYRSDSDIHWPYIRTVKLDKEIAWSMNKTMVEQKTKLVSWMASHCPTASKRERYVKKLQRYIPVDIYGRCGNLSCSSKVSLECVQNFGSQYKFYLSFENAFCNEYITEKFTNALQSNVVPVVMGGMGYKDIAPPNSYINVEDFESPKKLAEYLNFLDKNMDKYLEYFEWKKYYIVKDGMDDAWCDLCQKLTQHVKSPEKKTYSKLFNWLYYGSVDGASNSTPPMCSDPKFHF